jgi:hypothetical protein
MQSRLEHEAIFVLVSMYRYLKPQGSASTTVSPLATQTEAWCITKIYRQKGIGGALRRIAFCN